MMPPITPTTREIMLADTDLIVSKTDPKGRITYANRTFMRICGYGVAQLLGAPHSIIRHPEMPRGIFRLLWKTIQEGRECYAYIKNLAADGSFYWVRANVTPDVDTGGTLRGYFSVRRKSSPEAIRTVIPLYKEMLAIEARAPDNNAPDASLRFLEKRLAEQNTDYERFVLSLK